MQYVKAAKVSEYADRAMGSVRILGRPVAIIREPDGGFRALEAGCKHQLADLTLGRVQDDIVTCPRHGWRYCLKTGECVEGGSVPLKRYGCKIENGYILVTTSPLSAEGTVSGGFVPFE